MGLKSTDSLPGLIRSAQARITKVRRLNIILAVLLPLLLSGLAAVLFSFRVVPPVLMFPLAGLALLALLYVGERIAHLLPRATAIEAASAIDAKTGAKERFLTLASLSDSPQSADSLAVVEDQSAQFAKQFNPSQAIPLRLEKPARVSLWASPIIGVLLLAALLIYRRPVPTAVQLAQNAQTAQNLRELVETSPDLPQEVQSELLALAAAVEEQGLYSDSTMEQLEEALETVVDAQTSPQTGVDFNPKPASKTPVQKNLPAPPADAALEATPQQIEQLQQQIQEQQEQEQSEREQRIEKEQAKVDENPDGTGEPELSPEAAERREERAGGKEDSEQPGESKDSEPQKGAGEEQGQQGPGEQAKESGQGQSPQDDPKKDVTGVGEGKGVGKSGEKKQQHGETQSGQDATGAKEGDAENQSTGEQSGESQNQAGQSGAQKNQGEQGQRQPKDSSGKKNSGQNSSGQKSDVQKAQQRLEDLKDQIEKGQEASEQQGSGDKSKSGQEGKQQEGQQGDQKNQQGQQGQKGQQGSSAGSKQNQGQGGQKNSDSQQQSDNGQKQSGKGQRPGEKPGDKQGAGEQQNQAQNGEQRPGDAKTSPEPGKSGDPDSKMSSRAENQQDSGADQSATQKPDPNAKSKNADRLPSPNQDAERYGAFGGGTDGQGKGAKPELEGVAVPEQEKVFVRGLGQSDKNLYQSTGGTRSKTKLGNSDFAKPEAEVAESSQPIPVEYGDVLR